MFDAFRPSDPPACRCRPDLTDRGVLVVVSDDCPGAGRLADAPACRATIAEALAARDATLVRTEHDGLARTYTDDAVVLLAAAGRFAERVRPHEERLADCALRRPVVAGRRATGRAGVVARLAAETGLADAVAHAETTGVTDADPTDTVNGETTDPAEATNADSTDGSTPAQSSTDSGDHVPCAAVLTPDRAPTAALGRLSPLSPSVRLRGRWEVETGGTVCRYATDATRDLLHVRPPSATFDRSQRRTLAAAYDRLATGRVEDDRGAAGRAVRAVTDRPAPQLTETLRRHTRELGYLTSLLAVPGVTDATIAPETPVRVQLDGERLTTNVRFGPRDAATLASRVRAASGRGLSRADPTGHATLDGVRIAGVTEPAADGPRFAVRATRDAEPWTLTRLLAAGTFSPRAAATLSLALDRGVAALIAGPRGAGKTTTLAAALWALRPTLPVVVVEDTPELPIDRLQAAGREATRLEVRSGDDAPLTATEAVRTALRLGDGALVVGEVRGEEAQALYEAMRVGAAADAVLGTIHGSDATAVRERVVTDLGVPESAFAATDLVVTLNADHRLARVEEVRGHDTVSFVSLFDRDDDARATVASNAAAPETGTDEIATATGVIERGESVLLDDLTRPDETYADARDALHGRTARLRRLADAGVTAPGAIHDAGCDRA